jgi:hypothetical protein
VGELQMDAYDGYEGNEIYALVVILSYVWCINMGYISPSSLFKM